MGILGTLNEDSNLVLFRTTNGGTNFTAITNLSNPRILGTCGINILNDSVAYACGKWDTPARIIKTTDKGVSWSSFTIDTLQAKSIVDCYFLSSDSGIAVGGSNALNGNAVVLRTVDGGVTWNQAYRSSSPGKLCWKVSFVNKNLGYVSIQGSSYYLKSTNGGVSWEEKLFRSYIQQGIGFINENTGWIGGWTGSTYETTDAGNSWHLAGWGKNVNRFRFINDTLAYSVGERVYKYSTISVGINLSSSEIPSHFNLFQNYPNPFNPVTNLEFGIAKLGFVSLKVFDVLGKEVVTLVNEKLSPGVYESKFDGSSLSSGIYFYKLEAGDFIETKRMILIR
ncbi:MAG: T9SS type A sorting domain-containing protein [Ignavibacteria bacterium]|nr:T9SS type A sorting domain-containing protein [Ignavibacteria bacterium]